MSEKPFALSIKVVLRDEQGRCLVIRRSAASKHNAGNWEFPGGKTDPGETFDAALRREVAEETGLQIALRHVAGAAESEMPARTVAYLILEAEVTGGTVRLSDEHDQYRWVKPAELAGLDFCPQFLAFAKQYAGGKKVL